MLHIGNHKIKNYMAKNNVNHETAITNIMALEIKHNNLCENGYEKRGRTTTRHNDVAEIFKCK